VTERRSPTDLAVAVVPWLTVLALVAWSAWHRWQVLSATPYPVGIDGYFYSIQVRSLAEHGQLAYPAAPLTFWLMAIASAVSDPIVGPKLVAALVGALIAVPGFLLGRRLGGPLGGVAAAVVAVTSGGSFFLSLEFVKNGVGLTVAMTAAWLGARALEQPSRGRLATATLAVVAALLTHKMAAALVAALLAPAIVVELHARVGGARTLRLAAIGGAGLAVLAIVLGLVAPARFVAARDLAELGSLIGADPSWSLPAMEIPRAGRPPFVLGLGDQTLLALGLALAWIGASVAAIWTAALASPARRAERAIVWSAVAIVMVTAIPVLAIGDPDGLGFRLRVAVFAPAALVAAGLVGRAFAALAPWTRVVVLAPLLLVRVAVVPDEPVEGRVVAHPALVSGMQALAGRLPPDAVVITSERHLGFMATWYARVPVRLRPEPVPPARRWRLLAGNLIQLGSPLDRELRAARALPAPPIGLHPRDPDGLVVVPESTWEVVLAKLPPKLSRYWREWHTR